MNLKEFSTRMEDDSDSSVDSLDDLTTTCDIEDEDDSSGEDGEDVNMDEDDNTDKDDDEESIDNEGSSSYEDNDDDNKAENDDEKSPFKLTSNASSGHKNKGGCVKNQLQIWESLLETRIQLQKCIANANRLPNDTLYEQFSKREEFKEAANKTKNSIFSTLEKLVKLQNLLGDQHKDIKNILNSKNIKSKTEDATGGDQSEEDEEIPSDDEDDVEKTISVSDLLEKGPLTEQDEESEDEEKSDIKIKSKKLKNQKKVHDYESELKNFHSQFVTFRNKVINEWNEKTRIVSTKGASTNTVAHINHILNDKEKLIRKTQLKKSTYDIVGDNAEKITQEEETKATAENVEEDDTNNKKRKRESDEENYNTEIFDDDDFYHQLLRELIEVKSADLTDPVQLGRQWVQLQSLRSKMKRKIDTKCTKGRKIRYAVHNKLVNFMAPIETVPGSYEKRTEILDSIFKYSTVYSK